MPWTFAEIAAAWPQHRDTNALRENYIQSLTGAKRGWFHACRTYAHGGPSPHDYSQVNELLARMKEPQRRIAQLHIACADAVRSGVAPEAQWTSRAALTAEEEQNLRQRLEEITAEQNLTLPYGPAFLWDLTAALLDLRQPNEHRCESLFPLVPDDSNRQEPGVLAMFELERLAEGTGESFIAPEQAFTLAESFAQVFADAPAALRADGELHAVPQGDVRVRILVWPHKTPIHEQLQGDSGGGALALGLWSLWTGTPLQPGVVTSFSLRNPRTNSIDGGCYPIGGDAEKARTIAKEKGGAGLFLVATGQGGQLDATGAQMRLRIEHSGRLHTARVIAVGAGDYLRRRLEALRDRFRLYTPLAGHTDRRPTAAELMVMPGLYLSRRARGEVHGGQAEVVRERLSDLRDLLRWPGNFVLVGAPGCGKTFTLEALEHLALEDYQEERSQRLPVFLPLRMWDRASGEPREALKRFVCAQAPELERVFDVYLEGGRFLFLCDALNEMPEYERESVQVRLLTGWIKAFGEPEEVAASDPPRCRFLFTCRTENYQVTLPARRVDVAELDEKGREEMARNYLRDDPGPFLAALHEHGVWDLCENPLTLAGFLALYKEGRDLPSSQGGLFRALYELWFEYADRRSAEGKPSAAADVPRETVEIGLQALAYRLHDSALSTGAGVQTDLNREEARRFISGMPVDAAKADHVLDAAQELRFLKTVRVDRLFPRRDRVRFLHHRWQEFWTAVQIGQEESPRGQPFTAADWRRFFGRLRRESETKDRKSPGIGSYDPLPAPEPTRWEEPLLMLAGIDSPADAFVLRVFADNPVFAARCLYEGRAKVSPSVDSVVVNKLLEIIGDRDTGPEAVSLRDRIAAGRALGYLPDPRFPVDVATGLILPPMVEIGGTSDFVMGTTEADLGQYRKQLKDRWNDGWASDEQPAHRVSLNGYGIGKYPVTVREYAQFVSDGGYDRSEEARWRACWTEGGWEWLQGSDQDAPRLWDDPRFNGRFGLCFAATGDAPRLWDDPRFNSPSYPVVGVTWYEALAYVNWLNAKTGTGRYRLPSEAEWEYAGRGVDRHLRPWGNEWGSDTEAAQRCNGMLGENYVWNTTPVGMYPLGATAEGVFDLVGNVWEWCHDWYAADYGKRGSSTIHNPLGPEEGRYRVLRGGAWNYFPSDLRCAVRGGGDPDDRGDGIGFRVASGQ